VVAAAVVLGPEALTHPHLLHGVDDSKILSAAERDAAYDLVLALAAGVGVGIVPATTIDALGILPATRIAMIIALLSLPLCPDGLLIDAVRLDGLVMPQRAIIRGDSASLSVAAASVVAKVRRDRLMAAADTTFPNYGFARHKGYGTAVHAAALHTHGPCRLHRRTFQPLFPWGPVPPPTTNP
jgi:ribonuclease HII